MTRYLLFVLFGAGIFPGPTGSLEHSSSPRPAFHVLAFYTDRGEPDHIDFARQAIHFYSELSSRDNFTFTATTNWDDLNDQNLRGVQLVMWLNDFPKTAEQRSQFEKYMKGS